MSDPGAAATTAAAAALPWQGLQLCPHTHAPLLNWLAAHSTDEAAHALRMGIDLYEMQRTQLVQALVTREIQGQAAQLFQGALLDETQLRLQTQLAPVAGKLDQLQSTLGQMHNNLQVSSLKGAVGENLVRGGNMCRVRSHSRAPLPQTHSASYAARLLKQPGHIRNRKRNQ
jgi:hypothetical protein